MESPNNILLIQKYQPVFLVDYEMDTNQLELINTFIKMDNINLLLNGLYCKNRYTRFLQMDLLQMIKYNFCVVISVK